MLKIIELSFSYRDIRVLEGIDTSLKPGEILSVVGPNGTGKTTLLKCITSIITPDRGAVFLGERDTARMSRRELAGYLGYVPQQIPSKFPMTVFEMVLLGRRPHISWKPSPHDLERVADILQEMKLADLALRDVGRLSGGQRQKVLLARALAQDPEFLLLDEPTSSLDLRHQLEVMEIIRGLVRDNGTGAMIALHDLNLASRFSDRIIMLHNGRIFSEGPPAQVMTFENIRAVYEVEAMVRQENGYPLIQPLRQVI